MTAPIRLSAWDRLVGPDASRAENIGTITASLVGCSIAVIAARRHSLPRAATIASAVMAADLVGGVWTNMTPSCKRWYHRPGQGTRQLLLFATAHLHPYVLGRWHPRGWRYGLAHHTFVVAATVAVTLAPTRHSPTVAKVAALAGIALDRLLTPAPGCGWAMPAYYLKLLPGHAVGPNPPA
jgi:hypothetical protein